MNQPNMTCQTQNMYERAHPWHGLSLGNRAPRIVNCYIEMVPTDTVKYELDKATGLLKVDRPYRYSSLCPSLYGLLPQTYSGGLVAEHCMKKTGRQNIVGDGDPLDICVLTEKVILRGDIFLQAIPIGGFRLLDGEEADDKILAVLNEDLIYGQLKDIQECPAALVERLRHYFLTYKDSPDETSRKVQIIDLYGPEEAIEIINLSRQDYAQKFLTSKKS